MFLGSANGKDMRKGSSRSTTRTNNSRVTSGIRPISSTSSATTNSATPLSKNTGGGVLPPPAPLESAEDKVAEAVIARKHRELAREQTKYIINIQRVWRSYRVRIVCEKEHYDNLAKKFSDISKITTLLKGKGIVLASPPKVIQELTVQLLACGRLERSIRTNTTNKKLRPTTSKSLRPSRDQFVTIFHEI